MLCTDYGLAVRVEATVVRNPADGTRLWLIARFDQPDRIVVVLREREPAHQSPELEPVLADAARGSAFALFATDHDRQITVAVGQALADLGIDAQQVLGTCAAALRATRGSWLPNYARQRPRARPSPTLSMSS